MRPLLAALLAVAAFTGAPVHAEEPQTLTIAVAANLSSCIEDLDKAFEREHPGAVVKASIGASGNFFAQIRNGAPFEVLVSADTDYPKKLIEAKLADAATLTHYADGRLALWTTNPKVDLSKGLAVLAGRDVNKVAIANPDTAPYGRAAKAVIAGAGLDDKLKGKLVVGENIAQTLQFVDTGNADAGFVAFSLLRSPKLAGKGRYELLPAGSYPAIEQATVVTQKGAANPLAAAYVKFLGSKTAQAIFIDNGYALPAAAN